MLGTARETGAICLAICRIRCFLFVLLSHDHVSQSESVGAEKKERKKTDNPREGWEDGTPPPHRDFRGEVWC